MIFPSQTNNNGSRKIVNIPQPSVTVFMYDGYGVNSYSNPLYRIYGRHSPGNTQPSGKTNIAFFDGHAESAARTLLPTAGAELSNSTPAALITAGQWPVHVANRSELSLPVITPAARRGLGRAADSWEPVSTSPANVRESLSS